MSKEMIRALIYSGKLEVYVDEVVKGNYTYVKATMDVSKDGVDFSVEGHGFAKFNFDDRDDPTWGYNKDTGRAIATVRAVDELSRKLAKLGFSFITKWKGLVA